MYVRDRSMVVGNFVLYLHSFPLEPTEKIVLEGIASIRFKHKRAQPGWKEMGVWIHRSTRTVARVISSLEAQGMLRRVRRGKKLTNIYFIAARLWRRLIAGRKITHERADKHAQIPIDREKTRELLRQLSESLGKHHI